MTRSRAPRSVGYVLNAFPVISETFILNELRAMQEAGIPVVIFTLSDRAQRIRHAGVDELSFPRVPPPPSGWRGRLRMLRAHAAAGVRRPAVYGRMLRRALRPGRGRRKARRRLRLAAWIADAARRRGVAHLHAHYARDPLEVAAAASRLTGIPYSFAAHAKDLYTVPEALLARRLRRARFAVACHRGGEEHLRRLAGRAREKVMRVSHGIDTRLFALRDGDREPAQILAVGRLTPKKGFDDLIAACALLARRGRRFRCVIHGEGKMRAGLQAAIDAADLRDRVELRPFVSQEELPSVYSRATILAMPSRVTADGNRDGIPNVVVEAMACGLPLLGTRVGGIPEMVRDGETGILVPPGDPAALATALAGILDDPDRGRRMGRAAAAAVAGLDFRRTNEPLVRRLAAAAGRGREEDPPARVPTVMAAPRIDP